MEDTLTQPPPRETLWDRFDAETRARLERLGVTRADAGPAQTPAQALERGAAWERPAPVPAAVLAAPAPRRAAAVLEAPPPPRSRAVRRSQGAQAAREAREMRRRRLEAADLRRLEKSRRRVRELTGNAEHPGPRLMPGDVYRMMQDTVADATGGAGRIHMRSEPNKIAVGIIWEAAFVPGPDGCRYDWSDQRARRIVALGLALLRLSVPFRKGRGRWGAIVRGIPQGALAAGLRCPFSGRTPQRTIMGGRPRSDGSCGNGQIGYLPALREAGLFYAVQVPAAVAETWEICGPSGYATARYSIRHWAPEKEPVDAVRYVLLELFKLGAGAPWERPARMRGPTRQASSRAAFALSVALAIAQRPRVEATA